MTDSPINNASPALQFFRIKSIGKVRLGHWNHRDPGFTAWFHSLELGIKMVAYYYPGRTSAVINDRRYWIVGYENTGAQPSKPDNVHLKMSPFDPAKGLERAQSNYISVPWQALAEAAEAEGVVRLKEVGTSRGGLVLPPGVGDPRKN